jgi:thioredoxin 1
MLGPVFDKIATQYKNRLKFGKIDIDQFSRISEYERISAIPELIIYENGKFEKSISK